MQSFHQNRRDYRAAKQAGDTAKADALKATLDLQRAQAKELHAGLEQRVGSVLTAGQLEGWNAMKAERTARRAQHRQRFNVSAAETYIAANENRRRFSPPAHPARLRFMSNVRLR